MSAWDMKKQKEKKKKSASKKTKTKKSTNGVDQNIHERDDGDVDYGDLWEDLTGKDVNEFEEYFMVGLYGRRSSGKSAFALDFPDPIWYIDTEDGLKKILTEKHLKKKIKHLNLKRETKKMVELTGKIHKRNRKKEIVIDAEVLFHRLQIAGSTVLYHLATNPDNVGTVIIDDYGHLYKLAQEWRVDEYGEYENNLKQRQLDLGIGGSKGQQVGEEWDNARSWAAVSQKVTSLVELLKGQDCNVVLISKVKIIENKVTKAVEEEPRWHKTTEGICDHVIQMRKNNEKGYTAVVKKLRKRGKFELFNKVYPNKDFSFNYKKLLEIINENENST